MEDSRDSLRVGTIRAEGNVDAYGGCQLQILGSSDKSQMSSVPTGRLLRLIRLSSLSARTFSTSKCRLEQINGADEAVCQGRTSALFTTLILTSLILVHRPLVG